MRLHLLAAVASTAFIASGVLAQAQDNARHDQRPAAQSESRPAQGLNTQSEPTPHAAAAERQGRSATGAEANEPAGAQEKGRAERAQNGTERSGQRSAERPEKDNPARTGQTEQRQENGAKAGTAGQGAARRSVQEEQQNKAAPRTGAAEPQGKGARTGASEQGDTARTGAAEGRGQPKVVGNVKTSTEHASRASEILMRGGQRANVDIDVRVGARVPEAVAILPVPAEVLTFAPEYRGYDYFIENDEIVFVSPQSHEVVGMIEYEGRAAASDEIRVSGSRPCPIEK